MINIVAIDPSLASTGITINGKQFSIASEAIALTKKGKYNKWFNLTDDIANIELINLSYQNDKKYAKLEINKLATYQKISNLVRKFIDNHCDSQYNTLVIIEGYSYSSEAGPLIDLVTLGTLIRRQLFTRANTELVVLAPQTMKMLAAKLTYDPIDIGKRKPKLEYRNNEGIKGGSFTKHDIYKALIENDDINSDWVNFLRNFKKEILEAKKIPKPIEDINDSVIMYEIGKEMFREIEESHRNSKNDIEMFQETVEKLRQ